jgi:hypothetical protein
MITRSSSNSSNCPTRRGSVILRAPDKIRSRARYYLQPGEVQDLPDFVLPDNATVDEVWIPFIDESDSMTKTIIRSKLSKPSGYPFFSRRQASS